MEWPLKVKAPGAVLRAQTEAFTVYLLHTQPGLIAGLRGKTALKGKMGEKLGPLGLQQRKVIRGPQARPLKSHWSPAETWSSIRHL